MLSCTAVWNLALVLVLVFVLGGFFNGAAELTGNLCPGAATAKHGQLSNVSRAQATSSCIVRRKKKLSPSPVLPLGIFVTNKR